PVRPPASPRPRPAVAEQMPQPPRRRPSTPTPARPTFGFSFVPRHPPRERALRGSLPTTDSTLGLVYKPDRPVNGARDSATPDPHAALSVHRSTHHSRGLDAPPRHPLEATRVD